MADKILKLVNNDVLAEEFGSKARENIIEKYSTESILEKWLNLFNKLNEKILGIHEYLGFLRMIYTKKERIVLSNNS